ncbi:MAG TPA: hypothetical protein VM618_08965 [Acidimicrobiia bacterium]|nr:hypothetical protein [Acidimicrobiia bacterium]
MVIVVKGSDVALEEPGDLKGFKVVVEEGDETSVGEALARVGHLADRETAWIRAEAVREMAAGRVPDGWSEDFQATLDYAATKGWLSDDGAEIQAHIEWPA